MIRPEPDLKGHPFEGRPPVQKERILDFDVILTFFTHKRLLYIRPLPSVAGVSGGGADSNYVVVGWFLVFLSQVLDSPLAICSLVTD